MDQETLCDPKESFKEYNGNTVKIQTFDQMKQSHNICY